MLSTASSLSSISEDSTYGVEGEDLPPSVPRRRRSLGSRSVNSTTTLSVSDTIVTSQHEAETLERIHEEAPLVQESAEIDIARRPKRKSSGSRRSGSSRRRSHQRSPSGSNDDSCSSTGNGDAEEEEKEENSERDKRRRRSSTSRSTNSSQESSKGEPGSGERGKEQTNVRDLSSHHHTGAERRRSSSSHRRSSSSRSIPESKEELSSSDQAQQEEKLKELERKKSNRSSTRRSSSRSSLRESIGDHSNHSSRRSLEDEKSIEVPKRKSSKRSSRRSSSRSSERDPKSDNDEHSKQTVVEERRHLRRSASSGRRSRHSRSSSQRSSSSSSRHSSEWGFLVDSSLTQSSRSLDSSRRPHHRLRRSRSSLSENTTLISEASEEERPGAYRVSMHSTDRVMSVFSSAMSTISGHSFAIWDEITEADTTITASSGPESNNTSTSSMMVRAEVARDMTSEIAAARDEGLTQALAEASHRDEGVVVTATEPRRPKEGNAREIVNKRLMLVGLSFCFLLFVTICGGIAYLALNRQDRHGQDVIEQNATKAPGTPGNSSELDAVISFDPPTAADCASIMNGTDVAGQEDMFTQYVAVHIEITTESEEDAAYLLELLKQQVQLRLIPYLIGCHDVVGNVIGNGIVESVSNETSPCLFKNNPLCLEVVLTVKIYLKRNEDGTAVVGIMSDILLEEDVTETLELPPNVQSAAVSLIRPLDSSTDAPTDSPSWSPSVAYKDTIFAPPTAMPMTASPSTKPTTLQMSVSPTPKPTREPTLQPTLSNTRTSSPTTDSPTTDISTSGPTQSPTQYPTPEPTRSPTRTPTRAPTAVPIPGSTPLPTSVPSSSPSAPPTIDPTVSPTQMPSSGPSVQPSRMPSPIPSSIPSPIPSPFPSSSPSSVPSPQPSDLPSDSPSASPSLSASESPTVCTTETKVVPLFDAGVVDSYEQVSPGDTTESVQRFSCLSGASSDLGIILHNEADCTVECLNTVPFSNIQSYCDSNPAGGFTFEVPGPFTSETKLYIGHVDGSFSLPCGPKLPILSVDYTIGCFADASPRAMSGTPVLSDTSMTVQRCLGHCFQAGFSYAGLENGSNCYCDNNYMEYGRLEPSSCDINCVDGMTCGGDWKLSVYPTGADGHDGDYTPAPSEAPEGVFGCWNEDASMVITTLNPVWVGHCIDHCISRRKIYAGLRRLGDENKCYCGNSYRAGGTSTTCDNDCAGPCGGANAWNIYATNGPMTLTRPRRSPG